MKWTKKLPKIAGWYWHEDKTYFQAIVYVNEIYMKIYFRRANGRATLLEDIKGKHYWQGPLETPRGKL
jgi:hypothetical protein